MKADISETLDLVDKRAIEIFQGGLKIMNGLLDSRVPVAAEKGGKLKKSRNTSKGSLSGPTKSAVISYRSDVANFTDQGTRAHGPKTAKFLRFKIGKTVIFTKWVKGIKPMKWWTRTMTQPVWVSAVRSVR